MWIRISSAVHQILLFSAILFYSSECVQVRIQYFRQYKNYSHKLAIYSSLKLNFQESLKRTSEIALSSSISPYLPKPVIKIYIVPLFKFARHYISKGNLNVIRAKYLTMRFKNNSSYFGGNQSYNEINSERPIELESGTKTRGNSTFLGRQKRDSKSVALAESGKASAGSISHDGKNAVSKAEVEEGEALARSYAKGDGVSKASAKAKDMGDAIAIAKAKKSNSTSSASSKDGGDALAASESEGEGHAAALAQTRNAGSSTAVVQIEQGHGVATAIHNSNDPDNDENDTDDESEEKPKAAQMGRALVGASETEDENGIFKDKFLKTGQVKKHKKKKRKEGRKKEKKFRFARIVA